MKRMSGSSAQTAPVAPAYRQACDPTPDLPQTFRTTLREKPSEGSP